jgi:hypothetical protein
MLKFVKKWAQLCDPRPSIARYSMTSDLKHVERVKLQLVNDVMTAPQVTDHRDQVRYIVGPTYWELSGSTLDPNRLYFCIHVWELIILTAKAIVFNVFTDVISISLVI